MAVRVSWIQLDTDATPSEVRVSWMAFDAQAAPLEVRVSWMALYTESVSNLQTADILVRMRRRHRR